MRRWWFVLILCLLGSLGLVAAQTTGGREFFLSYSSLGLGDLASRVNDFAIDSAGRVWFATDAGVVAMVGEEVHPLFPLNTISGGLVEPEVKAIAFGDLKVDETGEPEPHFFLAYPNQGIQYGRVLPEMISWGPSRLVSSEADENLVNDMVSDSSETLWVASQAGLVQWRLGDRQSPERVDLVYDGPVQHLAVAPWWKLSDTSTFVRDPAVVFSVETSTGPQLYLVRADGSPAPLARPGLTSVAALTFDVDGNLWVVEADGGEGARYAGDVLSGAKPEDATPERWTFEPSGVVSPTVRDIAVLAAPQARPREGEEPPPPIRTVWLATSAGAYSQVTQGGLPNNEDWVLDETTKFDGEVQALLADNVTGNLWLGTGRGLWGKLIRYINFSEDTYLGEGARGKVLIFDLTFAQNDKADEELNVLVSLEPGSDEGLSVLAKEEGDTGNFVATFGFSLSQDPPPGSIAVASSPVAVPIYASYAPVDLQGETLPRLSAESKWKNLVAFEDDLWIGGPCFLRSVGSSLPGRK